MLFLQFKHVFKYMQKIIRVCFYCPSEKKSQKMTTFWRAG